MARGTVATVGYLNARPLTDQIDRDRFDVVSDHPAAIAERLHAGSVDLALVPVAAILDGGAWRIAPGVCIGADGPVDSVLLAAETPPEQWTEVVLDGESRTSAVLARLLLARGPLGERVRDDLVIRTVEPGAGPELARGTVATLVIGDAALALPARLSVRLDLAEQWTGWTGLPFVFAVWAGRPGVDPELVRHLRLAGEAGVAAVAEDYTGAERAYLTERIRYPLDDRALMGLRRFAALARQAGLLPTEHLELYSPGDKRIPRPADLEALLERAVDGAVLDFDEALRLEVAAPLAELAAAADLKRFEARPDRSVGVRLGWRMLDPDVDGVHLAEAVAAGATVVVVPEGTDVTAFVELWPDVAFAVGGRDGVAELVVGAGESGADRVRAILALRESGADRVRVVAADHPGKPAAVEANTAVDHLRAVALTRLLLDGVQVEASAPSEGIGMAQTSLRAGCDHLGTVFPTEPFARWDAAVAELERQVRDAGFEPVIDRPVRVPPLESNGVAASP